MNEDHPDFGKCLEKALKVNRFEAYNQARITMGDEGIVTVRGNQIIRLYPDDTFDVIKNLLPATKIKKGTKFKLEK